MYNFHPVFKNEDFLYIIIYFNYKVFNNLFEYIVHINTQIATIITKLL